MGRATTRRGEESMSSVFRIKLDKDANLLHQFKELFGQERSQLFHRDVLSCLFSSYVYRIYCLLLWKIRHLKIYFHWTHENVG